MKKHVYKNKLLKANKKGFTLIELLIVIAIIGILFIVLVSKVDFATDKAKATGVQTDFRSFQIAFRQVAIEQQGFPDDTNTLVELANKNLDEKLQLIFENGNINSMGRDPWGTEYKITFAMIHNTKGSVDVRAAGRDQEFYTGDDYLTTITYNTGFGAGNIVITSSFDKSNNDVSNEYAKIQSLAPGLYKAGTKYNEMIYSWQQLVDQNIIHVNNGEITTNYNAMDNTNSSTSVLDGILVLPSNVNAIGTNGFNLCENITEMIIPYSITTIKENAFLGMNNLTKTFYTGTLEQWCKMDLELYTSTPCWNNTILYLNGEMLGGDVVIPSNISSIGDHVFFGCQYITSFKFGTHLTYLGENNFWGNANLRNVYYTGTLEEWCTVDFEYNGNSCLYSANLYIDNVLMDNVVIPESVTILKPYLFDGCCSIKSVKLHSNIKEIKRDAFCSCSYLQTIEYDGTIAEWNAIPKEENWNAYVFDCTIKCSNGDIYMNWDMSGN